MLRALDLLATLIGPSVVLATNSEYKTVWNVYCSWVQAEADNFYWVSLPRQGYCVEIHYRVP